MNRKFKKQCFSRSYTCLILLAEMGTSLEFEP